MENLNEIIEICYKKHNKEITESWQELAEANGYSSGEALRSFFKRYRKMNGETSEEKENIIDEIESKKIEIEIERKKRQTISVEYNRILREEARRQLIIDEVKKSIQKVRVPSFKNIIIPQSNKSGILMISDIHYGKIFKSLTNEYSIEIFEERMNLLMSETIEVCRKEGISHLHIFNGGDSIEGLIHLDQLRALQIGLIDCVINFSRYMVEWLNQLSQYIEITYHHVPSANHTEIRPFNSKAGQFPKEDLERVVVAYIHDMLEENYRIEVPVYDFDYVRFKVFDYVIYGKHGHKNSSKNLIKDLSMKHHEFVDLVISGHYHHGEKNTMGETPDNNCDVHMAPSIMGSDEYADLLLTGSKAGALILILQEDKRKVLTYDIKLN